jgi:hypothetical protein
MQNTSNKKNKSLFEAFKGTHTEDLELKNMIQEYQTYKERILSLKNILDSYPEKLEGYKLTLESLIYSFEKIFDKEQKHYFEFMSNVAKAHKALNEKLTNMYAKLRQLKYSVNKWTELCSSIDGKLSSIEEKRKIVDHDDGKMAELLKERNQLISKGKSPGKKDNEKYVKIAKKYQSSAKDYLNLAKDTFNDICIFLNSRYDKISSSVVDFIEIEATFYIEASLIFNYFKNIKENLTYLKSCFQPIQRNYDPSNYIRGISILNDDLEQTMSFSYSSYGVIQGSSRYSHRPSNEIKNVNTSNTLTQTFNKTAYQSNTTRFMNDKTFIDPFSTNNNNSNYGNNNNNCVKSQYLNKVDNSISERLTNQRKNGDLNPYGIDSSNNNSDKKNITNPYNQGNNSGENPFEYPNV